MIVGKLSNVNQQLYDMAEERISVYIRDGIFLPGVGDSRYVRVSSYYTMHSSEMVYFPLWLRGAG